MLDLPEPNTETIVLNTNNRDVYSMFEHSNVPLRKEKPEKLEKKSTL